MAAVSSELPPASAIVVAAGGGSRLGRDTPKAFVELGGHPMLHYSIRTLMDVAVHEAVIAVPEGMEAAARAIITAAGLDIPVKIVAGGAARQDSVRIALGLTSAESELIVIHDAARPLATAAMFNACLAAATRSGGAIAAIAVADTLKRVEAGAIVATIARAGLFGAQTPQAFGRRLLLDAHRRAQREQVNATDDAELIERIGGRIEIVDGSPHNFKITTAADLELAEAIARARAR